MLQRIFPALGFETKCVKRVLRISIQQSMATCSSRRAKSTSTIQGTPLPRGFLCVENDRNWRVQLYAMTGVVGPVYASKRLFTRLDFQSDKGLESARYSSPSSKRETLGAQCRNNGSHNDFKPFEHGPQTTLAGRLKATKSIRTNIQEGQADHDASCHGH
jgi:hypothetical protein